MIDVHRYISSSAVSTLRRTNIETLKYRGKRLHWRKRRISGDYNAIVKRGNDRTSHQGQLISKFEDIKDLTRKSKKGKQ